MLDINIITLQNDHGVLGDRVQIYHFLLLREAILVWVFYVVNLTKKAIV